MNTIWLKNGKIFRQTSDSVELVKNLPNKIYTIHQDMKGPYLAEYADSFHFGFKLYGMETQFIEYAIKTFENTTGNLGFLFNGLKGTGKTITAKLLASRMNLPIILVTENFDGLVEFISDICCPVVLLFDEFEKTFNKDSTAILSIMDGVYNSPYRRIFLLTTNKLYINENLLGRPSRIRYKKTFGNLQPEVIQEYLADNLKNKDYASDIMEFVDSLTISTIDILKTIVEEVNIHDTPVSSFKNFFNVETAKYSWNVHYRGIDEEDLPYDINNFKKEYSQVGTIIKNADGEEEVIELSDFNFCINKVNTSIHVATLQVGEEFGNFGTIIKPLDGDNVLVTETDYNRVYYIKVLNIENTPSLYRGRLAY